MPECYVCSKKYSLFTGDIDRFEGTELHICYNCIRNYLRILRPYGVYVDISRLKNPVIGCVSCVARDKVLAPSKKMKKNFKYT